MLDAAARLANSGVGLTANSKGLVLSYSDVVNGKNVVSVQQGTGPALKHQTMYSNIKLPKVLARRGTGMQLFSRV